MTRAGRTIVIVAFWLPFGLATFAIGMGVGSRLLAEALFAQ